jgi:3-oxoacyl-[acyl-carrier protein] reductase
MEFKDHIVVVTGGTRGIGRAISLLFASQGACVFAAYLNNDQAAAALVSEAQGPAGAISVIKADVGTAAGAQALIDMASRESGHTCSISNSTHPMPAAWSCGTTPSNRSWVRAGSGTGSSCPRNRD